MDYNLSIGKDAGNPEVENNKKSEITVVNQNLETSGVHNIESKLAGVQDEAVEFYNSNPNPNKDEQRMKRDVEITMLPPHTPQAEANNIITKVEQERILVETVTKEYMDDDQYDNTTEEAEVKESAVNDDIDDNEDSDSEDKNSGDMSLNNNRNNITGYDRYSYRAGTLSQSKEHSWTLTLMKLQKRKRCSLSHLYLLDEFTSTMHYVFSQYTLKTGIKRFKDRGVKAMKKEMKQLHNKLFFMPIQTNKFFRKEKRRSFRALMFLKGAVI